MHAISTHLETTFPHPAAGPDGKDKDGNMMKHPPIWHNTNRYFIASETSADGMTKTRMNFRETEGTYADQEKQCMALRDAAKNTKYGDMHNN